MFMMAVVGVICLCLVDLFIIDNFDCGLILWLDSLLFGFWFVCIVYLFSVRWNVV